MRLLADENVHTGIIQGLRKANFEVVFSPTLIWLVIKTERFWNMQRRMIF